MVKFIFRFQLMVLTGFCFGQQLPRTTDIKSDHIRIDHYGQHDKPFESFVITMQPLTLYVEEWEIRVNEKIFLTSLRIVQENKISKLIPDENREFGIFKISTMRRGEKKTYYFTKREESIIFFKSWLKDIKNVKGSDELVKRLDYILSRIDSTRKVP